MPPPLLPVNASRSSNRVRVTFAPAATVKMRVWPVPLMTTPPVAPVFPPVGPAMLKVPLATRVGNAVPLRATVRSVAKTVGLKVMVLLTPSALAALIASRSVQSDGPQTPSSVWAVVLTT
jgi:hypothetical protein